jgi:hypothetical protein
VQDVEISKSALSKGQIHLTCLSIYFKR